MPLPFSAEPRNTGTITPSCTSLTRSANTLSRGGCASASSCSISSSSWSASCSSILKRASVSRSFTAAGISISSALACLR